MSRTRSSAAASETGNRPALGPIALAICLLGGAPVAWALPQGAVGTSGQTTVQQTAAGTLQIQQNSARASLDWNSFSIAEGERVNVVQPSRSSVLLNRVVGNDPSLIYGTLSSNGSVWLINPRGIVFGATLACRRRRPGGQHAEHLAAGRGQRPPAAEPGQWPGRRHPQ